MSDFNKDKKTPPTQKTCKDCIAFVPDEGPGVEGVCVMHPPQVVSDQDGECFSLFPSVNGESTFCLQLIQRGKNVQSKNRV